MSIKSDILKDIERVIDELGMDELLGKISEVKEDKSLLKESAEESFNEEEHVLLIPFGLMSGMSLAKPVFLFKDEDEISSLPIRLGLHQANLIALSMGPALAGGSFTIVKKIFKAIGLRPERVVFLEFIDQALKARFDFTYKDKSFSMDSTAEEVLSLALETGVEFFATSDLLEKAKTLELEKSEIQQELEISLEKQKVGQKYLM